MEIKLVQLHWAEVQAVASSHLPFQAQILCEWRFHALQAALAAPSHPPDLVDVGGGGGGAPQPCMEACNVACESGGRNLQFAAPRHRHVSQRTVPTYTQCSRSTALCGLPVVQYDITVCSISVAQLAALVQHTKHVSVSAAHLPVCPNPPAATPSAIDCW
jgi:hypothetical protein